jgi:hypothetical protein
MTHPLFLVYFPVNNKDIYYSSPIIQGSGGYLALFLLYSKLNEIGYKTDFISIDSVEKIKLYNKAIVSGDTIVIYPEAILGNPLNAKNIVRWIMYFVKKEIYYKWKSSGDLIVCYWQQFIPVKESVPELRPINSVLTLFHDKGKKRSGICWRIGKGSEYHSDFTYHHPENIYNAISRIKMLPYQNTLWILEALQDNNVTQLNNSLKLEEMQALFNNYRLFFSYDCESAVSIIAALCGCISIIVPKKNMKSNDLLPSHSVGIALGYEGIYHALSTKSELYSFVSSLEEYGNKSVELFAIKAESFYL